MGNTPPKDAAAGPSPVLNNDDLLRRLRGELEPDLEVLRPLGEEFFGGLFLAREAALRRLVVVKVLTERHAQSPENRRRFERAGLAAARITHPNVVPIFRVGTLRGGVPFYVEPYLGECTLGERLAALGRMEPELVRRILSELAAGLAAAHQQGIVHRGIHPGAVRCEDGSERVLLSDFGLSGLLDPTRFQADRLTPSGEILGSAGYMSPEQMAGRPATDRSDVFSLGLLAWRLLVGPGPNFFGRGDLSSERWAEWRDSVGDPGLVSLIQRCLSEDPHARPSAGDVARELDASFENPRRDPGGATLWSRLSHRRIPHALLIYLPGGWALLQVVDQLVQQGLLPRGTYLGALGAVVAGLPVAVTLAWYHGAKGRQKVTPREVWLLVVLLIVLLAAVVVMWSRGGDA